MCSISASFDRDRLITLCKQNEYRGQVSHSITYFTKSSRLIGVDRKLGPINYEDIKIPLDAYCIVHQQAPTSENKDDTIHPADYKGSLLWHNGILKPKTIEKLQKELEDKSSWDSYLLCKYFSKHEGPDNIDGSFACIYWDTGLSSMDERGELYVFRNEIAPLFVNKEVDISSTKFDGSTSIEPNTLWGIFLNKPCLYDIGIGFSTVENPYVLD